MKATQRMEATKKNQDKPNNEDPSKTKMIDNIMLGLLSIKRLSHAAVVHVASRNFFPMHREKLVLEL